MWYTKRHNLPPQIQLVKAWHLLESLSYETKPVLTYYKQNASEAAMVKKNLQEICTWYMERHERLFYCRWIKFESKINYAWRWNLAKIYNMQTTQISVRKMQNIVLHGTVAISLFLHSVHHPKRCEMVVVIFVRFLCDVKNRYSTRYSVLVLESVGKGHFTSCFDW